MTLKKHEFTPESGNVDTYDNLKMEIRLKYQTGLEYNWLGSQAAYGNMLERIHQCAILNDASIGNFWLA